jgi:large subunit ribosomal protein L39
MVALCQKNLKFERLEVNVDLALEMFKDNRYKTEQIPHIASQISEGKIFASVFTYPEYRILMF